MLTGVGENKPHVTRKDGGHLIISPKPRVEDRTQLTNEQATELMRLTVVVGRAMKEVLNRRGIDIGRINYQDNGNWSVFDPEGQTLHIHLYGRAKSAKIQKYGEALNFPKPETGFYDDNEPLTDGDLKEIACEIKKYWKIKNN